MANGRLQTVAIRNNVKLAGGYYKLSFDSPRKTDDVKPGQFLEVRVSDGLKPFLRKPLSIHSARKQIEILYEVVGEGTDLLSKKKPGEVLDIIGPLGNGFDTKLSAKCYPLSAILVAGGIGVAPLVALAERIAYSVERIADRKKIYVIIGAKTKNQILCDKEFKKLGCSVIVATEDGSIGKRGVVTDLLKSLLNAIRYPLSATIYACGPKPMLEATAKIAAVNKIPCQVLLEEYMACGIGACLGCAVMTKGGYKMVCKDGPVFNADEIIWE